MLLALDAIWRDIDTSAQVIGPHGAGWLANQRDRLGNRLGGWVPNSLGTGATPTDHGHDRRHPLHDTAEVARRLVVVDEAWTLMREAEGAKFLARMAKSARKRRAGLAVITQDATDLLGSDLGQVVVANSATQILMRQAPQAIADVTATLALPAGAARLLLTAERGHALLLSGHDRIPFVAVASSDLEHTVAAGWADLPGQQASTMADPGLPDADALAGDDASWR
jgi:hypothetical protein